MWKLIYPIAIGNKLIKPFSQPQRAFHNTHKTHKNIGSWGNTWMVATYKNIVTEYVMIYYDTQEKISNMFQIKV